MKTVLLGCLCIQFAIAKQTRSLLQARTARDAQPFLGWQNFDAKYDDSQLDKLFLPAFSLLGFHTCLPSLNAVAQARTCHHLAL